MDFLSTKFLSSTSFYKKFFLSSTVTKSGRRVWYVCDNVDYNSIYLLNIEG